MNRCRSTARHGRPIALLGFAALAGLPPVVDLYAALGSTALYRLWGSSRCLDVGVAAVVVDMESVDDVDSTGAQLLGELVDELDRTAAGAADGSVTPERHRLADGP